MTKKEWMKAAVEAVRNDKKVGRGSLSAVDECLTDEELMADLEHPLKLHGPTRAGVWKAVMAIREDEAVRHGYRSEIEKTAF